MSEQCKNCQSTGLIIMPVRYAPMPRNVGVIPDLPGWANDPDLDKIALGDEFKYGLRTLRAGYLYLYYEQRHETVVGSAQWVVYTVFGDGTLYPASQPDTAQPPRDNPACAAIGHSGANLRSITILKPGKSPKLWMAFSEHRWTQATRDRYEKDAGLRAKRMRPLDPKALLQNPQAKGTTAATAGELLNIFEYKTGVTADTLPCNRAVKEISTGEDGGYKSDALKQVSTRYEPALRVGAHTSDATLFKKRTIGANNENKDGVLAALHDAVGMVHELNGYGADAAGWLAAWSAERALQLDAQNIIDGVSQVLVKARAQAQGEDHINRGPGVLDDGIRDLQEKADRELASGSGDTYYQNQLKNLKDLQAKLRAAAAGVASQYGRHAADRAWANYEKQLDAGLRKSFKEHHNALLKQAHGLLESRTAVLVKWLEAQRFIDSLNDYDPNDVGDGLDFEEMAGLALLGIDASRNGRAKLDAWVRQAKASADANLLWRAMALNQQAARDDLDAALAEAVQHKSALTEAEAFTWATWGAKSLKAFADVYKKAQSVFDANAKANASTGDKLYGAVQKPVNTRGTDNFAITIGNAVYRYFRIDKLGDYVSEKIVQHIFGLRAFVDPKDSINLILEQAASDKRSRNATLRMVREQKSFMQMKPDAHAAQSTQQLKDAWKKFTPSEKGALALKESRLAVVVMLVEGLNFIKLLAECKAKGEVDQKAAYSLLASGMSIGSALFDVASVAAKGAIPTVATTAKSTLPNLSTNANPSWTYQKMKLAGGILSAGGAVIGAWIDKDDAIKSNQGGYLALTILFSLKAGLGSLSAAATLAVAFCNAAPLVGRLIGNVTGQAALGTVVENVGARAAGWLGLRIFGMLVGWEATIVIFGAQFIIWCLTPDALEKWLAHSALGSKRGSGGYKTIEEQDKAFDDALVELGYKEKAPKPLKREDWH